MSLWLSYPALEFTAMLRMNARPLEGRYSILLGKHSDGFFDAFGRHGQKIQALRFDDSLTQENLLALTNAVERLCRDNEEICLDELVLIHVDFDEQSAVAFARIVLSRLRRITIALSRIGALLQALALGPSSLLSKCEYLEFSSNNIGSGNRNNAVVSNSTHLLSNILSRGCARLYHLEISNNHFNSLELQFLAAAICNYATLPAVAALRGVIGWEAQQLVETYVSGCPALRRIDILSNRFSDNSLTIFERLFSWDYRLNIKVGYISPTIQSRQFFEAMTKEARFRRSEIVHGRRDPGERPFCRCCPINRPCDCGCTNL